MNVNVGIVGVSTGMMTTIAGLFGMNLVSGLEEAPMAFAAVTAGSTLTAVLVAGLYFNFLSGKRMQERAQQRLAEIETLTSALSDMGALDYTAKKMMEGRLRMNQEQFKRNLVKARNSHEATDAEVELLFKALDTHKDNELSHEDFPTDRYFIDS